MITNPSQSQQRKPLSAPMWCLIATLLLLLAISWPIILTGFDAGRGAADDLNYHWPAIQTFAAQLPTPDLSDYSSATTPGYHLELAVVHRLGFSRTFIQLYASIWTALLLLILSWRAGQAFGRAGTLLLLPFLASIYVLFPAIWLLPDNAAWLGVLVLLILALDHPTNTKTILIAGITLSLLVLIRQVHIWAASIIWIAAWFGSQDQTPISDHPSSKSHSRLHRLGLAFLASLPAALIILYFVRLWGGLVPPTFQSQHQGPNPATPAFILTQIAVLSCFFAPLLLPKLLSISGSHRKWILSALILGILLGALPESSFSRELGRYSGWWNMIDMFPTYAGRSPIIILGGPAGALACVIWCSMVARRDAWILVTTLVAFVAAQSANHASWQRYHEPLLLILGILILTRTQEAINAPKRVLAGASILAALLAAITIQALINAEPVNQTQTPKTAQSNISQFSFNHEQIP